MGPFMNITVDMTFISSRWTQNIFFKNIEYTENGFQVFFITTKYF